MSQDELEKLIAGLNEPQKKILFQILRRDFIIHPLEELWNVKAEVILEAIYRATDLTQRGIKGVIAEAVFKTDIIDKIPLLKDITPAGNSSFDFLVTDGKSDVSIQVKLQRSERGEPKVRSGKYIVETQKTRGGKDKKTEEKTRPYKFGEFDILAVNLYPSTKNWELFRYTVADWLLADDATQRIATFQPVSVKTDDDWTDDLVTCITWLRSGTKKKIKFQ